MSVMARRVITLDEKIKKAEAAVAAAKSKYDAALDELEKLVEKAGGVVCGRMAILAEGDAQNREDLIYLEKLPLFNEKGEIVK